MSAFIHVKETEANDVSPKFNVGGLYSSPDGKYFRYVQFKDAVTYAAGQVVTWAGTDQKSVTNDRSGGSSVATVPAGICLRVMTENYYGFILVHGAYSAVVTNGDDDIAAGAILIAASADGAADSSATVTAATFGYALAADVDAANTVAAMVTLL